MDIVERPLIAVLDTSVLFPAPLRDTLLRSAEHGLYRPIWSEELLDELGRNLVGDRGVSDEGARRLIAEMRATFPESMVGDLDDLLPRMTNHAKDRHVLAAAVAARAQTIVTANLRHLPPHALAPFNVTAQSPDAFLLDLFARAPDTAVHVLIEQAAALRVNPTRAEQVLERVARHAPGFAAAIVDDLRRLDAG